MQNSNPINRDVNALTGDEKITDRQGNTSSREAIGVDYVIQTENNTNYDRYPWAFKVVAQEVVKRRPAGNAKLLSFGCARGEEAFTLAEKYFTHEETILGVDISEEQLVLARSANRIPERVQFEKSSSEVLQAHAPFDAIFCMSVLCVWPKTMNMDDISSVFSFDRFSKLLEDIDQCLEVGGLLVIYNANYCFSETDVYNKYRVIPLEGCVQSGFVSKFDKANRRRADFDTYNEIIFEKIA
jgi:chemotaxis methyl-accepting protein methylase